MTVLRYIGETGRRFILEIKDGEKIVGYGAIIKADWDDVKKLLEGEK